MKDSAIPNAGVDPALSGLRWDGRHRLAVFTDMDLHEHWEQVYLERSDEEFSWYQADPVPSLEMIRSASSDPGRRIIDVGGGSSLLVDHLLEERTGPVTVLDISETALARSQERLGDRAGRVTWVAADVTSVEVLDTFDVWHDRAIFHFLIDAADRARYAELALRSVDSGGTIIIATFAPDGPERCSGLLVRRHDSASVQAVLGSDVELVRSVRTTHMTPARVAQPFIYSMFRRR